MSVLDCLLSVRLLFVVGLVPTGLILYFQIFLQKHLQCPFIGHLALEGPSALHPSQTRTTTHHVQVSQAALSTTMTSVPWDQ